MNKLTLINKAVDQAIKSEYYQKVGAIIFDKNIIVSTGYNQPLRSVRSATFKFFKNKYSVHAEVDAIIKAKCDLKGKSILVVRINSEGKLMKAKPCSYCRDYLNYVGIKNIYYSSGYIDSIKKLS